MKKKWIVVMLVAIVGVAWLAYSRHKAGEQDKRHGPHDGAPVTVTVAQVKRENVPIYLSALGTVQAYNTVTVRAQVSGQLIKVPFKEGGEVKKGDLLALIDPRPYQAQLDEAKGKLAQGLVQLSNAKQDLRRYLNLVSAGYVSRQQLDTQKATVRQDEALVQSDRAAVEADQVQLSFTRITSPISGRLGMRQVDVGNLVSSSDSTGITVVTQTRPISVVFSLPEQYLDQVNAAGAKPLTVQARDRGDAHLIATGQLTVVNNQIDTSTGTVQLKATFANKDEQLWPGQFVNVRVLVRVDQGGLTVPAEAVQRGPNGAYVYLVGSDHKAHMQSVTVIQTADNTALVGTGLKSGDRVVVDGQYQLKPGSKVKIIKPSSQPATPASSGNGG